MQYKFSNKEFNCDIDFRLENARFTLVSMAQYLITTKMTHVPHGTVVALENIFLSSPITPDSGGALAGLYVEVGLSDSVYLGDVLFDSMFEYDKLVHCLGMELTFQFIGISTHTANELPASRQALITAVALELQDHFPFKASEEIDRALGNDVLTFQHSHDRIFTVIVSWQQDYDIVVGTISVRSTESLAMMGIGDYVDNVYVFAGKTFIDLKIVAVPEQKFIDVDVNTLPDSFPWGPPHSHEPERTVLHVTLDPEDPNPIGTVEEIIKPILTMANKMADIENSVKPAFLETVFTSHNTIITGKNCSGKTTLGMLLAIEAAEQGLNVRYHNDEHNDPAETLLALGAKPDGKIVICSNEKLTAFKEEVFDGVYVLDFSTKTVEEIVQYVGGLHRLGQTGIIVIINDDIADGVKYYCRPDRWTETVLYQGAANPSPWTLATHVEWKLPDNGSTFYFDTKFRAAKKVTPLMTVTSQFEPSSLVYMDGDFYVATGKWASGNSEDLACRYHEHGKLGYPNGMGKSQWFRLPVTLKDVAKDAEGAITLKFNRRPLEIQTGQWVKTKDGSWHLVTYVYGDGDQMVSAIGLGKTGSYPIVISDVEFVTSDASLLSKFHKDRTLLWKDEGERVFLSTPCSPNNTEGGIAANLYSITEVLPSRSREANGNFSWLPRSWNTLGYLYQLNGLTLIGYTESCDYEFDIFKSRIDSALEVSKSTKLGVIFEERSFVSEADALAVSKCDTYFGHETYFYSDVSSNWK